MRQIKFRAKTKKNEWVYGYYVYTYPNEHRIFGKDRTSIEVNGETIGQFTGLKTKNGDEIYEGDVLKQTDARGVYVVFYNEKYFRFEVRHTRGFTIELSRLLREYKNETTNLDAEVIGNKFDNPELIKKEE